MSALPVVEYQGEYYFLDRRLNEIRSIHMPWISVSLDDLSMSELREVVL
jgi:hypothetical protein